jgi:hypothetical protein
LKGELVEKPNEGTELSRKEELQALLDEYERLNRVAGAALSTVNIRSRPNWHQFYEASEQMSSLIEKLKYLNGH